MMPTLSILVAPDVVIVKASGTASNGQVGIMWISFFLWQKGSEWLEKSARGDTEELVRVIGQPVLIRRDISDDQNPVVRKETAVLGSKRGVVRQVGVTTKAEKATT